MTGSNLQRHHHGHTVDTIECSNGYASARTFAGRPLVGVLAECQHAKKVTANSAVARGGVTSLVDGKNNSD